MAVGLGIASGNLVRKWRASDGSSAMVGAPWETKILGIWDAVVIIKSLTNK